MTWYKGLNLTTDMITYTNITATSFNVAPNGSEFSIYAQPGSFHLATFDTQANAEAALEAFMAETGYEKIVGNAVPQ